MDTVDVSRVEALLFDLGGVIVDIDFERAIRHWADAAGREVEEVRGRFAMDVAYEQHETGHLDSVAYFASLRTALALDLDDAQLLAGWNAIFLGPTAGMAKLLAAAAERFPLHLFSNTNPLHHAFWAETYAADLAPFTTLLTSSDLGVRKPTPESFAAVSERIGVPLGAILFFDDTLANVEGALAVGMPAVHVRTADDVRRALVPLGITAPA